MYTREEVKAVVDKIINMAGADEAQVNLSGGERSGTRWANSAITVNMVQYDRNVSVSVRFGQKSGNATTRDFSDAGLKAMVDEAVDDAKQGEDNPNLPELLGPQEYIPVDAALPDLVNFGPAERARMVRDSIDLSEKMGTVGAGFIPKTDQVNCTANSKGLFAYYRVAETSFVLTCRTPDGTGSGWAGTTGIKDIRMIDARALTEVASNKAVRSRKPRALEPGRYTVILEPRASARFLSLVTGVLGGGGGGGGFLAGKQPGDQVFSELFTVKSDIGNPILRQNTFAGNNQPLRPVTWIEKGRLRGPEGPGNNPGVTQSLVQEGSDLSIEDMVKQTRRGLLVTFLWYIRGVPSQTQPLLNTGMTRDGLFLIENGEIAGPVQNFRWNMSPLVGYNNLTLVGRPVPMHMGESYDGGNTGLIPPVRIEDFYMTSISPAVAP
jgi:predicted Zn-dependent protease